MIIKHIVSSGCSQTQDGIGGCPPNIYDSGGCSFIPSNDYQSAEPGSWVSFIARELRVNSLVNTAASGHGNFLVADTIIEILRKFPYSPDETMVLFNLTWANRLDVSCERDNPDRCSYAHYPENIIPFSYFSTDSKINLRFKKSMGIDTVEYKSALSILGLFNFLENSGFQYQFLLAGANLSGIPLLQQVIESRKNRLIELSAAAPSIAEYVCANGLNRDIIHPTVEGHRIIGDIVVNHIRGI